MKRSFPILLALFIAIPLVEIYLFIEVGSVIGALPTVALIILTAVVGVSLLRLQGLQTMARFQQQMVSGELPTTIMLEGAALLFGGALLLTPGFLTDAIGFLCLIPFTRRTIIHWLIGRVAVGGQFRQSQARSADRSDPHVIEGNFESHEHKRRDR